MYTYVFDSTTGKPYYNKVVAVFCHFGGNMKLRHFELIFFHGDRNLLSKYLINSINRALLDLSTEINFTKIGALITELLARENCAFQNYLCSNKTFLSGNYPDIIRIMAQIIRYPDMRNPG